MKYMLMIYSDETKWAALSEAERQAVYGEYGAFTRSIRESGAFVAGDPLHPATTATTVRVRKGKSLVTDGPFAETKEQLGGYYIVEAKDLDEATAMAARIPSARDGVIEVRRILDM